jgi:hypothetical protein
MKRRDFIALAGAAAAFPRHAFAQQASAKVPPASAKPAPSPTISLIETTKINQILGEMDKEFHKPTLSLTETRYGLQGVDLGYSFEHEGKAYFLFGDTVGVEGHALDSIATTDGNADATNPDLGVRLDFVSPRPGDYTTIRPPGISMGAFEVPVSGISLNGQMYVAVITNFSKSGTTDRSVLTKFVAPSTFQTIRTISQLPEGRFIRMAMHAQPGPFAGLPAGGPFIFVWGTGKNHESDAYLSIIPAGQFESGKGTRYFAGLDAAKAPTWSDNESDATPVVKDGTLGNVSVTWCQELGLWLMTFERKTQPVGIAFSYSRTPWGPWSEPEILFNAVRDNGFGKFIHNPRRKIDDGLAGPVMGHRNQANADEIHGGAYAPYVVERWTKVQGATLNLYYVMSTGNPYLVVLMQSRLQIE